MKEASPLTLTTETEHTHYGDDTMTEEYEYPDDLDEDDYPQWHEDLYETLQQFGLADKPRLLLGLERIMRAHINNADASQLSGLRHQNSMLQSRIQEASEQIKNSQATNFKMAKLLNRIYRANPNLVERMEAEENE